jgi:endonuclease/exonuclease/phosphatase family metal-dependent hydrolase
VNSVAWRTSVWDFVRGETVTVPYFGGQPRQMPLALLEHRATGRQAWFLNVHNPADARGPAQRWRDEAMAREVAEVDRLLARGSDPVFVVGDLNENRAAFCRFTRSGDLSAAAGGSSGPRCRPPAFGGVDWIFGGPRVQFDDWTVDRSALARRATDHPVVSARAQLLPPPRKST